MKKPTITPEDYVSYPLALALKKAGFDWPCDHCYLISKDTNTYVGIAEYPAKQMWNSVKIGGPAYFYKHLSAPTLWQAAKWLREKHHINVRVSYISYHKVWFADWQNLDNEEFDDTDATFATYEEALSDGITTVLELINEKGE